MYNLNSTCIYDITNGPTRSSAVDSRLPRDSPYCVARLMRNFFILSPRPSPGHFVLHDLANAITFSNLTKQLRVPFVRPVPSRSRLVSTFLSL